MSVTVELSPYKNFSLSLDSVASLNDDNEYLPFYQKWFDLIQRKNVLESMPLGIIITLTQDIHPGVLFGGGTWERYSPGRVLRGTASGAALSSGGEYGHVLTVAEMPSHRHQLQRSNRTLYSGSRDWDVGQGSTAAGQYTGSTGGSTAHNNIQPYDVVYYWKLVQK